MALTVRRLLPLIGLPTADVYQIGRQQLFSTCARPFRVSAGFRLPSVPAISRPLSHSFLPLFSAIGLTCTGRLSPHDDWFVPLTQLLFDAYLL